MKMVKGVCALLMLFAVAASLAEAASAADGGADEEKPISYTIQEGDTLYLVATQYYNAPSAAGILFQENKAAFKKAWDSNTAEKRGKFGPDTIYPNTVIKLPYTLDAEGSPRYLRRRLPMARGAAERVANEREVTLESLGRISLENQKQIMVIPPQAPTVEDLPRISKSSKVVAHRESLPAWYRAPADDMQKCGKKVCDQFKSLCYFECLVVAKRFSDGNADCKKGPIPAELPYELDVSDPDRCVALMH